MQGKTLYTILLSIIAVLTLALAVLVIFLFTAFNNGKAQPSEETGKETAERVVPVDEQAELKLYSAETDGGKSEAIFNIRSTEEHPNSFLLASVAIIYDCGEKNKLLEERQALLEKTYLSTMKEATIEYFMDRSYDELKVPDAMKSSREALLNIYNGIVSENPEEKIVIKVIFDKWIIQ